MNEVYHDFVISSMIDYPTNRDALHAAMDLDKVLQKELKLADYTTTIKEIDFVFMAMNPATTAYRKDREFWRRKRQVFDIFMNVPNYDAFCNATAEDAKHTVAQLYLKGIETYLSKRKDIDYKRLYDDVKQTFGI